jgi:MFS family permease
LLRSLAGLYAAAFSGISRPVWLLSAATLVNRSGTMVMPFLALYFTERRGLSVLQAGQMLALYGVGAMVASYAGGRLCDFVPPRRVMTVCLLGTGAGFLILARLETRGAIALAILCISLAGEGFRPANSMAITAVSAPGALAQSFSLHRLALNLGMSIGPAVGGVLAHYGYGWLFVVDGGTCFLAAAVLWRFYPAGAEAAAGELAAASGPAAVPASSASPAAPAPPAASAFPAAPNSPAAQESPKAVASTPTSPWRDPVFLGLLFLMMLLYTVFFQLAGTFMLTLRSYGFSEPRIGLAIGVNALFVVLFEMALVQAVRPLAPLRVAALGSFLVCGGFALLPVLHTFPRVVAGVALWSAGEMLTLPILGAVAAGRGTRGTRGRYQGLYYLVAAISFVIAPLVGTWVFERFGPMLLWRGCGVVGVVLAAGFLGLAAAERRGLQGSADSGSAASGAAKPR